LAQAYTENSSQYQTASNLKPTTLQGRFFLWRDYFKICALGNRRWARKSHSVAMQISNARPGLIRIKHCAFGGFYSIKNTV
jgi:hypothetical protein